MAKISHTLTTDFKIRFTSWLYYKKKHRINFIVYLQAKKIFYTYINIMNNNYGRV